METFIGYKVYVLLYVHLYLYIDIRKMGISDVPFNVIEILLSS
jgi:hypothetical protein